MTLALLALAPAAARAGETTCGDTPPAVEKVVQAAAAAKRLERALDGTGAELAVIARVGSDLSRHGITWTHAGLVWRDDPAGRWQVRHALNECAGPTSRLFRQGLMNFFLDEPLNYRALVLVPAPALRQATVARIASGAALSVHQPLYSALAYPYVPTYQNSNQFVLENLALARAGMLGGGRETAIAQLRQTRFQPYIVRLTGFERLGGSFKANLHFDDHPRAEADDNRYAVVTVDTIERWLVANDALAARVEVK